MKKTTKEIRLRWLDGIIKRFQKEGFTKDQLFRMTRWANDVGQLHVSKESVEAEVNLTGLATVLGYEVSFYSDRAKGVYPVLVKNGCYIEFPLELVDLMTMTTEEPANEHAAD